MLDQEDLRVDARSEAKTAQFEPGTNRGRWPDIATPEDPERQSLLDAEVGTERSSAGEPSHKVKLHRHPAVFGLASASLLLLTAAGYLDWDNAGRFETTDDAYIASRQFAIAPEVSGYLTAVPVTDNEQCQRRRRDRSH